MLKPTSKLPLSNKSIHEVAAHRTLYLELRHSAIYRDLLYHLFVIVFFSDVWHDEPDHVLLHQGDERALPGQPLQGHQEHLPRPDHHDGLLESTFTQFTYPRLECSGTPLVRPPLLHQKSGLSRGVAFCQG